MSKPQRLFEQAALTKERERNFKDLALRRMRGLFRALSRKTKDCTRRRLHLWRLHGLHQRMQLTNAAINSLPTSLPSLSHCLSRESKLASCRQAAVLFQLLRHKRSLMQGAFCVWSRRCLALGTCKLREEFHTIRGRLSAVDLHTQSDFIRLEAKLHQLESRISFLTTKLDYFHTVAKKI